jgi:hypothetical protein
VVTAVAVAGALLVLVPAAILVAGHLGSAAGITAPVTTSVVKSPPSAIATTTLPAPVVESPPSTIAATTTLTAPMRTVETLAFSRDGERQLRIRSSRLAGANRFTTSAGNWIWAVPGEPVQNRRS